MSRAILTHFDGDPFVINFWLKLYEKYWRGECDKVYVSVFYHKDLIPPEVEQFNRNLFAKHPEIQVYWRDRWEIPELANEFLFKQVTEDYIGFVESDGFIFGKGIVDQCFRLLENEKQDIVAPRWCLIDHPYINLELGFTGFMRCFFFAKHEVLNRIDFNLMPKDLGPDDFIPNTNLKVGKNLNLDCFGWISLQLTTMNLKITETPANLLGPDKKDREALFGNFKWVHVRQMSSSALGLGGGEYGLWRSKDKTHIIKRVLDLFNENLPGGAAEWIHLKAVAFRMMFYDSFDDKHLIPEFADEYKQVLKAVCDYYSLPTAALYELIGFMKGVIQI